MTEKNYNPEQIPSKTMKKQDSVEQKIEKTKIKKENKEKKRQRTESSTSSKQSKDSSTKEIIKKPGKKGPKKTEAIVKSSNIPISTKYSISICKFIKGKKIESALDDLNQVRLYKKAIPMKGEIPHRKGKIMSGRYPQKAVEYFTKLLKNLLANANVNDINNPVITEAVANIGSRPFGRFGRVRRKRTHIKIVTKEKNKLKRKKK